MASANMVSAGSEGFAQALRKQISTPRGMVRRCFVLILRITHPKGEP